MAVSGMRYKKTLDLIEKVKEKRDKMKEITKRMQEERTAEVDRVYGGQAANNFKENTNKVSSYIEEQIEQIITQLTTEAETQHDAYIAQEQKLQSTVQIQ